VEAIRSGAVLGHLGVVRELRDRMRREIDPEGAGRVRTVVTGGYAERLPLHELDGVDAVEPLLTLRGLALLAARQPVAMR
jgi:pantothenate kinase type III